MDKKRRKISGYNVEELAVGPVHFEGGLTMFFEEPWAFRRRWVWATANRGRNSLRPGR